MFAENKAKQTENRFWYGVEETIGLSVRDYIFENTDATFNARILSQKHNDFVFN